MALVLSNKLPTLNRKVNWKREKKIINEMDTNKRLGAQSNRFEV